MLSPTDQLRSADNALVPDARSVATVLGQIELIKRKPDFASRSLKNSYKSKGCVFNGIPTLSVITQMQRSVTNSRLQEITGEHAKDITGVLQNLVRDGLLTQQNQRRWASYRLAEDSPPIRGGLPSFGGGLPPELPSFGGELPSFDAGTPVIGGTSPAQRQAAYG